MEGIVVCIYIRRGAIRCHLARIVRDCRHGQIERSLFCHLVELFERTWRECICCIHEEGVGTFGTLETQIEAVRGALGIDMEAFEHRIALFCGSEHALRLVGGRSIDDEHLKAPLGLGGQAVKGTVQGGGSIMCPHDDGHRGVSVAIPCHFAFSCPFCRCQVGADMLPPQQFDTLPVSLSLPVTAKAALRNTYRTFNTPTFFEAA